MRHAVIVGICLPSGACLSVPLTLVSLAGTGFSYALTDKGPADHGMLVLANRDSAIQLRRVLHELFALNVLCGWHPTNGIAMCPIMVSFYEPPMSRFG